MTSYHAYLLAGACLALTLQSHTATAESRIDRQTETAVPRSQNLYGIGLGVLPKTSGSDEYRALVLPIINANYGDRFFINALQAGVWLLDSEEGGNFTEFRLTPSDSSSHHLSHDFRYC